MKCKVVILACWSAAIAAFGADEVRLVEDGVAKCRVVVSDDASRPEKFGARELATYFDKVTGCGALDGAYPIRVTVDAANPDLREDGFVLDVTPQGLTVTGANPRGALYGCYEILKRYAGMRWLVPGEDGEYCVHEGKSIVVPVGREVQNAYLRIRKTVANSEDAWLWHARNNMTCETGSWRFKDRRTGKPTKLASRLEELCVKGVATAGNSHILAEMMSGWAGAGSRAKMDALFAAHPEWFPLVGGRRVPICRANDPNPCVSNAGLLDLMASNLYERVRGPHGSDDYVTIGNNDTTTWCECEKCRALDAPELADTKGARADRYWHLVGEIARRVWARDPSIRLGGWCYQDFWYPPARVKIDPRLRVFVSFNNQCWRHAVDDEKCTVNAEWRRIYRAWSRLGLPLVVNRDEISTLGAPGSSFSPIERTLCKNVLAYPSFGCSGSSLCVYAPFEHKHIYQAAPYFGKSDRWYGIWQGCYMIARMMWSPSGTDVDRDLEEACRLYYGEAAWNGGMREFRRLLTAAWTQTPGCSGWGLGAPLGRCLDQAGVEDRLVAFMENAVKAAEASGDARAIAHVRRDGDMFELTWRKARKEYVENFKELTAYRQTDEIRIDGALDESDWRNADVLGNFSPSEMMRKTCPDAKIQPSFVRVVYSPETLYVAVECMEPSPEKMIACRALPGDATKVWPSLGEHVELFYNYPDMGDRYYHLIINAHGAYIAAVQQSAVVRTPLKTSAKWATKVLKDRWTLEVAIPTSEIGMKCFDGATWKLNVGRVRKSAGLSTPKNSETSSCCNGKFHGASNFVNVKFAPRRAEGLKQSASPSAWSNSGFEETRSNATLPKYYQWRAFTFPEGDDSVPAAWDGRTLRGQLLDEDGNRLVRILPGKDSRLSQYFVSASPGSVNIRFRLRGSGRVSMETALYTDSDGARGYRMQKGTMRTETFEATEAWRAVTVERTKNGLPTERLAVRFRALPGSQIDLDDVIVSPRPPPKPLAPFPFPDRLSACVWRNWGLVSVERLAETLGATADEITALAGEMGLKPAPKVLPAWRRKGYITIVRRNWHLLPEEQILRLIDMDAQEFAYRLKEDDFLWHKLGFLKPDCEPLKYTTAAAAAGRDARRRLVEILKEENVDPDAPEEPRFAFVDELKALDAARPPRPSRASPFKFRMISSYFADYGDPLADDEIGSFPEGLLQKLAHEGVNAVWMHVVLNTLVKDARYPEFGAGSERRRANLKRLVARAKKYGIKVYLYLNEPRCLSTAFFETDGRAAIRGAVEAEKGVAAMCTSVPEVRRWLRDSLASLFSEVKGLGGVFTITMSENLTNCASHNRRETCPRCKGRPVSAILAEVNRTIAEGVAAGDPSAETIVWNWAWPKGVEKDVFPNLPKGKCRVMHVSENGIPVTVGGVTVPEHDYSIAVVGPGENARSFWRTARANGLPVLAKVQACNSWELSSFPFIPALDLVAEQAANLAREGVEGVMLSWSCGSAPAMNLRVYGGESLDEIAADVYGAAAAPFVRRAWTAYSEGFRRYPFDIVTVYKGPMQWGPANPLYPKATGYQATMVGFPYDALNFGTWDNQWHGRFPVEAWISRFDEVARGFAEGNRRFAEALAHVEPAKRAAAERDLAMFRAEEMHFRSTVDQSRFILARDAGDTSAMRRLALKELATAKEYLPLVRADSRIGYECSNHYYYVPRDVVEKMLACRLIADAAKPRTVRKPEISWSVMHPIVVEPDYMKRLVAKAAEYGGVDSFEICGECNQKHGGLNGLLAYEPYPKTAAAVDHAAVETYRRKLRETVAISHAAGKPVYFWHREGFMPKTMHEDLPGLLDEDGEYDLLGKPYLDYVRWKVREAFRQVPELDGVVLTLTEADFSVIHNSRPERYPPAKVVEAITRIFLEEHRRLGKRLIFRSFGSIKSDYESLIAGANACADDYDFEIETKITPYDFSPFLPANPYLKKTSRCTIGAECDGLGEYLGCGYLPCAQVEAIRRYVGYGHAADVDRYTIRIDRVGNSIFDSAQEVNLYAYHRFIQDPSATVEQVMDEWAAKRWPKCAAEMKDLAAKSFRLVEATQFIDRNVCFHQNPPPPSFKYVKFSGIFGTFRDGMDLHMTEPMWGMMSGQKTPGRAAIRAEKALAERLATEGFAKFQTLKGRLDPAEYARQFRAWSIAAKAVPAMRAYYDCVCAYFDDMDANDAAATRLTAAIAAAEKVILPRMKSTKVDLSEFNLNACRARGEDLDKVYFVTFLWLSRELLNEYRADFVARQKFLSRADVLDFVIPGGIYDDVRVRRVMHASYQTIDGGVPVRFVGNAAFPNGTIAVEFKDVPGAKVEIDADPAYAKDFNVSETVANGIRTVMIAKKGATYPGIRSIALVRPDVVVETSALRLVIGGDGCAKSLVCKATGEECLVTDEKMPLFESIQVRPFNNETRLVQQAKRTAYPANRIRRVGDRLIVGFETAPYEIVVKVTETADGYVTFKVDELLSNTTDERQYYQWNMDVPPVETFRLLQLPVKERANFGDWLNVMWDERAFVGVMGGTPYMDVDSERRNAFRKLTVDALKPQGLTNGVAVLAVAATKAAFLSQVDAMERDLGLPRGVSSRKDPRLSASIFWIGEDFKPENVDEIIRYMRMGGFKMLLVYFPGLVRAKGFCDLPDYEWNEHWNDERLTRTLARFHREGISVGFHTLQTFIGLKSPYVTPEADHRLALLHRFTLAQPLPADERPCEIFVEENPISAPMQVNCRFLKFGTEIFHYEGYTTTRPYKFTGVTRRYLKSGRGQRLAFESRVKAHPRGEVGGVLGISECAAESAYIDQDSSLQDEIAEKIARIYKCGFDFLYFDGSENANEPCSVNISLSQYRCVEACARAAGRVPLFTEGCAKSHFGWHFQSGANAFDMFGPEIFKEKIIEYPLTAAQRLAKDFTRVDFGWWGFWPAKFEGAAPKRTGLGVSGRTVGTQLDMWEFGTSKATAFDCPATMQLPLARLRAHKRAADILEMVRRWEDVRARGWLSSSQKNLLRDPKREWHLYRNEKSEYELVEWRQLAVAGDLWSRVRAFVFERGGKRVVAYWDIADKSRIVLADGKGELEAENLAYWTTELSRTDVEAAFAGAVIKPMRECETRQSLRDTCWLWGHETGQVDGPKNNWGLAPATNDYPMVEAAKSLGLESLNVIRWDCPDKAFRDTLRGLRRVTWPMCGIPKAGVEASFDALCEWNFCVAAEMPNVTGFDLDDFFRPDKKRRESFVETPVGRRRACPTSFPYEKLVALRKRLDAFPRPLELRTVVYDDLFHQCLSPEDLLPLLELTDVVTYWTWKAASTDRLDENFKTLRRLVPTKRIQFGIYLYDFGDKKEMDVRYLERQLAFGLARWRCGEIEGFVFLCSSLCNRDTPAVRFVRDWLKRHGDETRTVSVK